MSNVSFWTVVYYFTFIVACCNAVDVYCVRHDETLLQNNIISTCQTYNKTQKLISKAVAATNSSTKAGVSFDLTCLSSDAQCDGVRATFQTAADILSDIFVFQRPININATFLSFCKVLGNCVDSDNMINAGQAVPSVSYVMFDPSDNVTRMYPQALLKQFNNLSVKPNWDQYDIDAQFNTEINWYFTNNPNPIQSKQTDFLRTVLHELIHGLGFVTSWSDDLYNSFARLIDNLDRFITPSLLAATSDNQIISDTDKPQPFWGFVEYPLDKLIYGYVSGGGALQPFTSYTQQLNTWSNSNALFNRTIDMANSWYNSSAFVQAKTLYQSVTTALDVLAVVNKEPILRLETSLNPFSSGSSLCHVDLGSYINSTEYLMVYTANEGVSVDQLDHVYPQGPIGPKLLAVMAGLGYSITAKYSNNSNAIQTYQPPIVYWSPPNGLVQTSSNPSPSLTVNTNGPAHYPSSTSTSLSDSLVSSATSSSSLSLSITHSYYLSLFCTILFIYSFI